MIKITPTVEIYNRSMVQKHPVCPAYKYMYNAWLPMSDPMGASTIVSYE